MMTKSANGSTASVLVLVANGSEDIETVTVIDVLRRAHLNVTVAVVGATDGDGTKVQGSLVTLARGVKMIADITVEECTGATHSWDMVVLPGGNQGAQHLQDSKEVIQILTKQNDQKKFIAAICAAPAVVLARHGFLENKTATCYPSMQKQIPKYNGECKVVVDGHIITSQGPGTSIQFALTLVENLVNTGKAQEIAEQLVYSF